VLKERRRKKLERERDEMKRRFEEALLSEQRSKLGSALDEYCDEFEKAAGVLDMLPPYYLGTLGTVALLAGVLGVNKGMSNVKQEHRYDAMKQLRKYQLADRRMNALNVLPQEVTQPPLLKYEADDKDDSEGASKFGGLYKWAFLSHGAAKVLTKTVPRFSNIGKGNGMGITGDFFNQSVKNVKNKPNFTTTISTLDTPSTFATPSVTGDILANTPINIPGVSDEIFNTVKTTTRRRSPHFGSRSPRTQFSKSRPSSQITTPLVEAAPAPAPSPYGPGILDRNAEKLEKWLRGVASATGRGIGTAAKTVNNYTFKPVYDFGAASPHSMQGLKYLASIGAVPVAANEIYGQYNYNPYTLNSGYHFLRGHEINRDSNGPIVGDWITNADKEY
jgi:hypothetical protein